MSAPKKKKDPMAGAAADAIIARREQIRRETLRRQGRPELTPQDQEWRRKFDLERAEAARRRREQERRAKARRGSGRSYDPNRGYSA